MQNVAVGWFVYDLTHSAWSLGLTGLFTFLPALLFALVTGQVADNYDRRMIVGCSYGLTALVSVGLLTYGLSGLTAVWPIYILATLMGAAKSFGNPASKSLLPNLVPREAFANAVAWTGSFETFAQTAGPAIGGLLYMLGAQVVFLASATLYASAAVGMFAIRTRTERAHRERPPGGRSAPACVLSLRTRFCWARSRSTWWRSASAASRRFCRSFRMHSGRAPGERGFCEAPSRSARSAWPICWRWSRCGADRA
jgi:MFS family permease